MGQRGGWRLPVGVFMVALTARLVTFAVTGGLGAFFGYDQGVYYAGAASLAAGRLPYVEFAFVHPPGILVALLPFAELGRLVGDPDGLAAARVGWAVMGAVNTVLVTILARRFGLLAGVVAGLGYAAWPALLLTDTTVRLEPLVTLCLLAGWALLTSPRLVDRGWAQLAGGVALGLAPAVKIWAMAPVLVTLLWVGLSLGGGPAARAWGAAVASCAAVCLPFFVASPGSMWRAVVTSQLGRPRIRSDLMQRWADVTGLDLVVPDGQPRLLAGAALPLAAVVILLLAWRRRDARLFAVLSAVQLGVLLASPSYFGFYAAFVLPAFAITLAAACAPLAARADPRSQRHPSGWAALTGLAAVTALILGVAGTSASAAALVAFPADELAPQVADAHCVSADSPIALIALDVLGRNLERGCPVGVDVSGLGDDTEPVLVPWVTGRADIAPREQQRELLDYLSTGQVAILMRRHFDGFSPEGRAIVAGWPELTAVGSVTVRRPTGWLPGPEPRSPVRAP